MNENRVDQFVAAYIDSALFTSEDEGIPPISPEKFHRNPIDKKSRIWIMSQSEPRTQTHED